MHQLAAVGKPSSACPNIITGQWERLGSGRRVSFSPFLHYLLACGDQCLLQKIGTHNCSHKEENMAPSFKRRGKTWSLSSTQHSKEDLLRKEGTVSRGFSVWGGSNPQMLPSRRVLEPWCSSQPWVRVRSCSYAEAQLKVSSLGPAGRGSLIYLVSSSALHL